MSKQKLAGYTASIEATMYFHYEQLGEKNQRHYAATEAIKLGHGGITYISDLFGTSRKRIRIGIAELNDPLLYNQIPVGKQRRFGGGRKPTSGLAIKQLHDLISKYKAGSPTNPDIYWIELTDNQLSRRYFEKYGTCIGSYLVRRELRSLGYKYRSMSKSLATGHYENRDLQFRIIFQLVALMSLDTPILSMDSKKKERLGNLYRAGKCWSSAPIGVYDHDYWYLGKARVIPHGLYDMLLNKGYISIGGSSETAAFITDNLLWWWTTYGIHQYPDAKRILILCDAGGGNSAKHHIFKKQLQLLSKEIGLDIIICHYPPYASKWNPIEHRLFAHVHAAMSGVLFSTYEVVQKAIQKTTTKTGLTVVVRLNLEEYKTGLRATPEDVDPDRILYHKTLPELNYTIVA